PLPHEGFPASALRVIRPAASVALPAGSPPNLLSSFSRVSGAISAPFCASARLGGRQTARGLSHRLQFADHSLDHPEADAPEPGVARVEAEWSEQFGIGLRAAGRQHGEITLGEAFARLLVDAVERIDQAIAEGIGVDIEGRMDEMANIGP